MEKEKLESFYSWQAGLYDFTRKFFLFNRKEAIKMLELENDDKVIDLACGTGLNLPYLLERTLPLNILGIDYSIPMLKIAKKKYPEVKLIRGDVSSHRFSHKADRIVATYSISMIEDWQKTIINVKKTLSKNGKFVILDFYQWRGAIKVFYPLFRWWLKKHGVSPEKKIEEFARKYFRQVKTVILNSGYNFILIASNKNNN